MARVERLLSLSGQRSVEVIDTSQFAFRSVGTRSSYGDSATKIDIGGRSSRIAELSKNADGDLAPISMYDGYGERRTYDWGPKPKSEGLSAHYAVLLGTAGVTCCPVPDCAVCVSRRLKPRDKGVLDKLIGECGPSLLTYVTISAACEMLLPTSSAIVKVAISTLVGPPRNLPDVILAAGGWLAVMPSKTK
jgi:hypothetical protein